MLYSCALGYVSVGEMNIWVQFLESVVEAPSQSDLDKQPNDKKQQDPKGQSQDPEEPTI